MTRPLISVCVSIYNQAPYIERCLKSILAQDVDADLEILLGDDCSDDGTSEIIARFIKQHPGPFEYVRNATRLGPTINSNSTLARAQGDFVARIDGDDYWLPNKLATQLDALKTHPNCVAVFANALTVNESNEPIGIFNDIGDYTFDLPSLLRRGNALNHSSPMYRAYLIDDWLKLRPPIIDYKVHLLHARKGPLLHLGQPLVAYRVASKESLVSHSKDLVRELYWQAIQSVPRALVSEKDLGMGIADFYRRVLFQSVRMRSLSLPFEWWPRVTAASPYGRIRTFALILGSCIRMATKELIGLFNTGASGARPRVLYKH